MDYFTPTHRMETLVYDSEGQLLATYAYDATIHPADFEQFLPITVERRCIDCYIASRCIISKPHPP